ncbi:MAG: MarC family protein [Phenylobacterium sp.]|uniref:MarC family protein n=1 Tax=Phenylobacterium sp. TaxID=1871053 RepID=UPI002735A609|nr:MarC family protein [Phenylobacterium sp.]MDP3749757.1 MarC family protein [Phenylobacterium sp.]
MSQWDFAVNFFVALFALIDPIGNVPLFAAATNGVKGRESRLIAVYLSLFVLVFLTFFYFSGLALLEFFGISLAAFRIAGGVILFLLGLDMVRNDFTASLTLDGDDGTTAGGKAQARARFERMIVPFAMPLLIGPGAISTVVIYASEAKRFGLAGAAVGVAVIAALALATMLSFWATPVITKLLGRIGLTIVVRVLGLILCALAVQFILAGIAESTAGVILREAAAPYAK